MYLGLDVGGTHTDAVLLSPEFDILASAKALTRPDPLVGIAEALSGLLSGTAAQGPIRRLTVSTTLGLNSLLTGTADKVGVLATGGPGLPVPGQDWEPLFRVLSGAQDHRGQVIAPADRREALEAARELAENGAQALVAASKFGPKNPELENLVLSAASEALPAMSASALFGGLNFRRRVNGAVLNASVKRLYDEFLGALGQAVSSLGLSCPVCLLKSDGGVMDSAQAGKLPVQALGAGPAASLLGLWAISLFEGWADARGEDILMVDMGGTSADLAIISQGQPLLTPQGLSLAGKPTLVRGLLSHSLALGGDTDIVFDGREFRPEPRRRGPALALGSPSENAHRPPTLTDALNVLGLAQVGRRELSREGFSAVYPGPPEEGAKLAAQAVLDRLSEAVRAFIDAANREPVYTISEFLVRRRLEPSRAVLLGGPAQALSRLAGEICHLPVSAPDLAATANALGAALAKPTRQAELYADTALGLVSVPALSYSRNISQGYDLDQARRELLELMGQEGEPRVTFSEIFNQIGERGRSGRVMRVRAQSVPGLLMA